MLHQTYYKNNQMLDADEIMSLTLKVTIALWTLERIDPRLPLKVKKNYGHQMVGNKCLMSLQPTIFNNIGAILSELDAVENACVTGVMCRMKNLI